MVLLTLCLLLGLLSKWSARQMSHQLSVRFKLQKKMVLKKKKFWHPFGMVNGTHTQISEEKVLHHSSFHSLMFTRKSLLKQGSQGATLSPRRGSRRLFSLGRRSTSALCWGGKVIWSCIKYICLVASLGLNIFYKPFCNIAIYIWQSIINKSSLGYQANS